MKEVKEGEEEREQEDCPSSSLFEVQICFIFGCIKSSV